MPGQLEGRRGIDPFEANEAQEALEDLERRNRQRNEGSSYAEYWAGKSDDEILGEYRRLETELDRSIGEWTNSWLKQRNELAGEGQSQLREPPKGITKMIMSLHHTEICNLVDLSKLLKKRRVNPEHKDII